MSKIIFTRGIPGCGKSTLTKQMVAESHGTLVRICKDDLRIMLHQTHRFGLEKMDFYNQVIWAVIQESLDGGYDIVLDETFIRLSDCQRLLTKCEQYSKMYKETIEYEILDFTQQPFEETLRRDRGRHPSLGYDVLYDYKQALEREGTTCSITESLQESFGRSILVTTISSEKPSNRVSA